MITTEIATLGILIIHFVGDFLLQTDWQAKNKSSNWRALLAHTATYSALWYFPCLLFFFPLSAFLFCFITFVAHTTTDYVTSRIVKYYFSKGDHHNGFVVIGFDQILHYVQLYLTLKLLL